MFGTSDCLDQRFLLGSHSGHAPCLILFLDPWKMSSPRVAIRAGSEIVGLPAMGVLYAKMAARRKFGENLEEPKGYLRNAKQ